MQNPLISVIIPVYNVEKYLRECIDSVINQTYDNLEVILVDDDSPDNCGKICDEYAKKDGRIRVVHKENGGLSDARNCGIEASSGDYLMFVDSDDWVENDIIEFLHSMIIGNNADISGCGYFSVFRDGVKSRKRKIGRYVYTRENALKSFLSYGGSVSTWARLYKKELFKNVRFIKGKTAEEYYFIVDIISAADIIVHDSMEKYYYRQRKTSLSNSFSAHILDPLEAGEYVFQKIKNLYPSLVNYAKSRKNLLRLIVSKRILQSDKNYGKNTHYKSIKREIEKDLMFIIIDKNNPLKIRLQLLIFVLFPGLFKRLFLRYKEDEMLFD